MWYIAVEEESCMGCAFKTGKTGTASFDCSFGLEFPSCSYFDRKDNRNVIFVESDADNFGDEE